MASRKRTEITVETHEVLIVKRGDSSVRTWCFGCNAEVRMIGLAEAGALTGNSTTGMLEMIDAGEVHCLEAGTCDPLICLKSLVDVLTSKPHEPP